MRLLLEAHHPAHIHFFKYAIKEWVSRGDQVLLLGRDRDVMRKLLQAYTWIPNEVVSGVGKNNRFPWQELLRRQAIVARKIASFRPDVMLSLMGSYAQAAGLLRVPNIVFTDSEFQHFNHRIAHPFATRIYTPECFWKDLGPKQRRYKGYHELAFLHPKRFQPDASVLHPLGLSPREYLVVRVSAWDTLHDVGQVGFGAAFDEFMEMALSRYRVLVVPEGGKLDARWEQHRVQVPPHRFHDVLAHARFVISEGASTAAEAACLGVPSIYVNSTSRGYLDDMQQRYGLVSNHSDSRSALRSVRQWLERPPTIESSQRARAQLLGEHIDVTGYVVREIDELARRRL